MTLPEGTTRFDVGDVLVPRGSAWSYLDDGSAPAGWQLPGFDDSTWASGPAHLGYGDGDDASEVPEMQGQFATLYAVTEFELGGAGEGIDYLIFRVRYDDGYVAWINGSEVYRSPQMAPGASSPGAWLCLPHLLRLPTRSLLSLPVCLTSP